MTIGSWLFLGGPWGEFCNGAAQFISEKRKARDSGGRREINRVAFDSTATYAFPLSPTNFAQPSRRRDNMSADLFNLTPPLVGKPEDLLSAGQSLAVSLSPLDNSLAVFVTNAVIPSKAYFYTRSLNLILNVAYLAAHQTSTRGGAAHIFLRHRRCPILREATCTLPLMPCIQDPHYCSSSRIPWSFLPPSKT